MSSSIDLPTTMEVRLALEEILAEAQTVGGRPSVLALARRFGLTNTTFRRHFPEVADQVAQARRMPPQEQTASPAAHRYATLQQKDAELRRDNASLAEHLELAIANIHRLTLENHQLRRALESASKVTRIDAKTRAT